MWTKAERIDHYVLFVFQLSETYVSPLTPNTTYNYQIVAVATYPRPVEGNYSEIVTKTTMVESE